MIDDRGAFLKGVNARTPAVMVFFDDRHIWSFTPATDGQQRLGGTSIVWPHVLLPYLTGPTRVRFSDVAGEVYLDEEHQFGAGTDRIAFVDKAGHPLAIDKMGHITRSFESTAAGIKAEILVGTQTVIRELRETCGVEAWLGYGALLGAVREGGMIAHDSDTDVCYTSRHSAPVDIVRETHMIERRLKALGWDVLRMSGGDLKVIWPLSDGRSCHIDVFSSFFINGDLYILGEHGEPFLPADLLPLSSVTLDGYEFPAPANPEAMLVYLYGEGWRVPDPGFSPTYEPVVMSRLDGWLRGFRNQMGDWTVLLRGTAGRKSAVPRTGSEFAAWVNGQIGPDSPIFDLGAGNGRDSVWFAEQGHRVRASDYSRRSIVETRAFKNERGVDKLRTRQLILNEFRHVLWQVAEFSRWPHHLYARQLIGCLDAAARQNLYLLARTTTRHDQSLWLEFSATAPGAPDPAPAGLVKRVDPDLIEAEIIAAGGRVDYREVAPGVDMFDNPDPAVARIKASWPSRSAGAATKETH